MALSKDQAVKLATEHLRRAVEKELTQYFRECEVRDVLPDQGNTYWSLPGNKEDYWYIEVPHFYRERPLHVGGGPKLSRNLYANRDSLDRHGKGRIRNWKGFEIENYRKNVELAFTHCNSYSLED
jgi:hypothetical protein